MLTLLPIYHNGDGFRWNFVQSGNLFQGKVVIGNFDIRNVKGTVSRDGFGFWWHVWLVLGLNRGQGQFLNFITQKVYFSLLMRVFVGLILLAACSRSRFPCFLWVKVWEISLGISPCFSLAWRLCKFYAKARGKRSIQRQTLLVQFKQQANPLLSMNNYTPLVIS